MKVLDQIIERAKATPKRIVLCEGDDPRIMDAAVRAAECGVARITLVGDQVAINGAASDAGHSLANIDIVDPSESPLTTELAHALFELRGAKGMTETQAEHETYNPLTFANLLVRTGHADGSVAGAVHTTSDVVRSAIQLLGVRPGMSMVSSFFLMVFCEPYHRIKGGLIFSDCGLVIEPDAEQLATIALAAADSGRALLNDIPRVAMLSFSTHQSARHATVDRVIDAARRVHATRPELAIDEDVQLDSAIVPEIAQRKLPDSRVGGKANVLVFPSLEAGNIGYKLAERMGGAKAIGPLLQGLNKPANDLSRGCSAEDVYYVIAVTAVQAQAASQDAP
ncbi:phosphate acetyltransferase [Salinisphaera aquimarina]|uniref:Phosphate acetyltransferase n=1 Tax=Salinisphaera aquimarina TaxID=2094031 RepID=A0ABV7ESV0_9GAMM